MEFLLVICSTVIFYFTFVCCCCKRRTHHTSEKQEFGQFDSIVKLNEEEEKLKKLNHLFVGKVKLCGQRRQVSIVHADLLTLKPKNFPSYSLMEFYLCLMIAKTKCNILYLPGMLCDDLIKPHVKVRGITQLMIGVDIDQFDAAVSFVKIGNQRWALLFVDANNGTISLVDSEETSKFSEHEAVLVQNITRNIRKYFQFRNNFVRGGQRWMGMEWRWRTFPHDLQKDSCNGAIATLKYGELLIKSFPWIDDMKLHLSSDADDLEKIRYNMIQNIYFYRDGEFCYRCSEEFSNNLNNPQINCKSCLKSAHFHCIRQDREDAIGQLQSVDEWKCRFCTLADIPYPHHFLSP